MSSGDLVGTTFGNTCRGVRKSWTIMYGNRPQLIQGRLEAGMAPPRDVWHWGKEIWPVYFYTDHDWAVVTLASNLSTRHLVLSAESRSWGGIRVWAKTTFTARGRHILPERLGMCLEQGVESGWTCTAYHSIHYIIFE